MKQKYTSERNFIDNKSVDKRALSWLVTKKLNGKISFLHIASVVNILFEELFLVLFKDKIVSIGNFGSFILKYLSARRHYNLGSKQIEISKGGKRIIRFKLDKKVRQKLMDNINFTKTFEKLENE